MRWRVTPSTIAGTTTVPGDKSIGHRALLLAGLATGTSHIRNLPGGGDVAATARCLSSLGVVIEATPDGRTVVTSPRRWTPPDGALDAGNSGTTMRLLAGLLVGQTFHSQLTGDASLSQRPMRRVVEPLCRMGAEIRSLHGHAPLDIEGRTLHGIDYTLPVASAQVKSSILLAGLLAEGRTTVHEPIPTRDHTERMLSALGVEVERSNGTVAVQVACPCPLQSSLPGDISSAAFLICAALLSGGRVSVLDVGVNPTRLGLVDALKHMGSEVVLIPRRDELGEPVGDLTVSGSPRAPVEIGADEVPAIVDELPLLALVATQAPGMTVVRGARELRVKESDRIASVVQSLGSMGARIRALPDGFVVDGPSNLRGAKVRSGGDHRLALMLAVAGTVAQGETVVDGAEAAVVSYPNFVETLRSLGGRIDEV